MKKKFLGVVLSVAMVASLLAGCGSKNEEAPANNEQQEAPADDAEKQAHLFKRFTVASK